HKADSKILLSRYASIYARIILEENSIKVEYPEGSRITSRTATFDGDELKQITWTEAGRHGPYTATRKKERGKYVDKYVLSIPSTNRNELPTEIEIEGKFELRRDGSFRYVGQDFTRNRARRLHQFQEINNSTVRQYTTD